MAYKSKDKEAKCRGTIKLLLFSGLYVCIACGCMSGAPYKYTDAGDVSEEPATISGDVIPPNLAQIGAIDGKSVGFDLGISYKLTPGKHTVGVHTYHMLWYEPFGGWEVGLLGGAGDRGTKKLYFNAEAGHNYDIHCEYTSNEMRVWIEDKATGSVVPTRSRNVKRVVSTTLSRPADPAWQLKKAAGTYCPNADNGQPDAQLQIGDIYYEGRGIKKNIIQAYVWYSLAAKSGNTRAADQLTKVVKEMSVEQRSTAEQRLSEWKPGQCQSDLTNAISETTK